MEGILAGVDEHDNGDSPSHVEVSVDRATWKPWLKEFIKEVLAANKHETDDTVDHPTSGDNGENWQMSPRLHGIDCDNNIRCVSCF